MKRLFPLLLFLFILKGVQSQSSIDTFSIHVSVDTVRGPYDTLYHYSCNVTLADSSNIHGVKFQMGSGVGLSNLIDHTFRFDGTGTPPATTTWSRQNLDMEIQISPLPPGAYYLSAAPVDTSLVVGQSHSWDPYNR